MGTIIFQYLQRGCILLLWSISVQRLSAQTTPVITSKNTQTIGDTIRGINADTAKLTNEGAAGTNITWNFSTLDSVGSYTRNTVVAAPAPSGKIYSTANQAEHIVNGASDIFQYCNVNSNDFTIVGFSGNMTISGITGVIDSVVYADADTVLKYPFTYNDSLSDTSLATYYITIPPPFSGQATMKHYQGRYTKADGYGTLILPNSTYNNVLRYKNEISTTDSIVTPFGTSVFQSYTKEYYWVSPDYRQYLLYDETVFTKGGSKVPRTLPQYFSNPKPIIPTGMEMLLMNDNQVTIYPNPCNTNINLRIINHNVTTNCELRIYDLLGCEAMYSSVTNHQLTITIGDLKSGMYFYKVISGDDVIGTGKLIVQ